MIVAFDTETELIAPGRLAPPIVCMSWQTGLEVGLAHWPEAYPFLKNWLTHDTLVGHDVDYDIAVVCAQWPDLLPLAFRAYKEGRITDTKIRQQLLDIAAGTYRGRQGDGNKWVKYAYTLDACHRRAVGHGLQKDGWRMCYSFFRDVPLVRWQERAAEVIAMPSEALVAAGVPEKDIAALRTADPAGALEYPNDDAIATMSVFLAQEEHKAWLEDQYRQAYAAFCLHLTSCHGLVTDPAKVAALMAATEEELEDITARLQAAGFVRADGSRDTKKAAAYMAAVCEREGKTLRLTPKDGVCLDSDACQATEDDLLIDYADFTGLRTVIDKDGPILQSGLVQTSFGLAESGRTTSSKPNIQNLRRAGKTGDVRSCFVPRPGKVFAQADYDGLELRTLAQCCYTLVGHSALGDALNAGQDPHSAMAASILGISYEEGLVRKKAKNTDFDHARQTSKVANFGFPGGLGPTKLVLFARKTYKVDLTEYRAKELKEQWLARWPEMREYFRIVDRMDGEVEQLFTKRFRGGCSYTASCNTLFQGLGADCAKAAYCLISEACYTDKASPLYGCRVVAFVHDEFILEVPDDERAEPAAKELARLMILGANRYLPGCHATTEPTLLRYWSKEGKAVFKEGRLVPWPE